jgi:putative sigma-54 modulation protein
MPSAIQISFEGVRHSDAIEGYIRNELENLRDVDAQVTSSTIVVAPPRAKHFSGDPYRLRVRLTVEGGPDINVSHDPGAGRRHDAQAIAVRDTFRIVRRRLEDSLRRRQSLSPR